MDTCPPDEYMDVLFRSYRNRDCQTRHRLEKEEIYLQEPSLHLPP